MEQFTYPEYEYDEDVEYADYYDDYDYANLDADDGFGKDEEWDSRSTGEGTDNSGGLSDLTYQELLEYCVGPTLSTTAPHLGLLLAWALAFSLAARTFPLPASASHFLSITCGICAICQMFGWRCLYLLGQVAVGGASVAGCAGLAAARCVISAHHRSWIITLVCLAYMLLCELYVVDPAVWHSVRGAQMIILMKIVSYAHDVVGSEMPDGERMCGEFVQTLQDNVGKVYAQTIPYVDDCDQQGALNVHSVSEGDHKASHKHVKENIITETSGEQREINNADNSSIVRRRNQKSTSKTETRISPNEKKSFLTNKNCTTIDDETDKASSKLYTVKGRVQAERSPLLDGVSQGLELCGYLLHPGTVVFGPWCSLATYRQTLEPLSWSPWGVVGVTLNLLVSGACLVASTCLVTWVLPDNSSRWVLAYRDALSFRVSHYFVCHLSEASAVLGGLPSIGAVARAQHVELPRSLLSVVTNWNVPMHVFLKKHVFLPMRGASGVWCAVFATYAASALIHGLNAQLCAVLLSLALYTHAEQRLRVKLSKAFDACVLARPCLAECSKHRNNGRSTCGLLINLSLGAVCMWHLAYLGVLFDSTPGNASGYSLHHTLHKWGKLNYASHWVVVATYIVTALI